MGEPHLFGKDELSRIVDAVPFPGVETADMHGLLAYGGDLTPERLLSAYARGVFPWYEEDPILWFSPDPRMLLLPGALRINRTLAKNMKRQRYQVRFDTVFTRVIEACARIPRLGQDGTWITADMIRAFVRLHELGFAHSVEAWEGDELVGGVYGISLGAAFFGESMFSTRPDASKVAFVALVRQIESWDFAFLDCQVHTPHTERLGAVELPRDRFLAVLAKALTAPTRRGSWQSANPAASRQL